MQRFGGFMLMGFFYSFYFNSSLGLLMLIVGCSVNPPLPYSLCYFLVSVDILCQREEINDAI